MRRSGSTPAGRPPTAGSTSATPVRTSSSCCCGASSSTRGCGRAWSINVTDVNDKIYDAARDRRPALGRVGADDDRRLRRGHGPARARPAGRRAPRDRDDRRHRRADLGPRRRRATPTSPEATSTSACGASTATASSPTAAPTTWTRARRRAPPSSRRTRSTSRSGRRERRARTPRWPSPWGEGRPGWHIECSAMAEAELGTEFAIHGGGSDLVFPHHENEIAQSEAARGVPLARIWMHNGMVEIAAEKMSKSVGNIFQLATAIDRYGPEAVVGFLVSGHYRQPLEFSQAALEESAGPQRADPELPRAAPDPRGVRPRASPSAREAFLDALADDFNTPRALAELFELIGEANRRALPGAREAVLELLPLLGLEAARRGGRGGRRRGRGAARRARAGPRGARLRARGPDPRRARRARLGGPRHARRRSTRPHGLITMASEVIYGRRPVEEAKRGRRRVLEVLTRDDLSDEELERRCGSPDHQGVIAEVEPYPYADPSALLAGRGRDRPRPRPGPGPAQPRRDLPLRRGGRRRRRRHPRAPRRRASPRRSARPRRAPSSTSRSPASATSPTGSGWPRRPGPGSTAPTPRRRRPTPSPTTRAGSCSSSAARRRGCGRGSRRACDALVSIPRRGRVGSLNVSAAAAVLAFEVVSSRRPLSAATEIAPVGRG